MPLNKCITKLVYLLAVLPLAVSFFSPCNVNASFNSQNKNNECSDLKAQSNGDDNTILVKHYTPPEWNALSVESKTKLSKLLSWESLSKWDYDMVQVADLTREDSHNDASCPLLLVGWALLCEPMAQEAMKHSIDSEAEDDTKRDAYHYNFAEDDLNIDPQTICNFLREIERRYQHTNPYHNTIHAADVTQTTHSLFQMMDHQYLRRVPKITIFSLYLAATFHDVGHPGTNNLFQTNARTEVAIRYNDESILENMHADIGSSLLFGEERTDEWDIFKGCTDEDKMYAQSIMKDSILATDMSKHDGLVKALDSLIGQVRMLAREHAAVAAPQLVWDDDTPIMTILEYVLYDLKSDKNIVKTESSDHGELIRANRELANMIVKFPLHAADIANSAKSLDVAVQWAHWVMAEFFAQGESILCSHCMPNDNVHISLNITFFPFLFVFIIHR